jgi:hypothetical protein
MEDKMEFEKEAKLYDYRTERKGGEDILYFNYNSAPYSPSLEDYPEVMERTVDALIENPNVTRIVLVQQKNYNYDFVETNYLLEIASLYVYLSKQEKILSHEKLVTTNEEFFTSRYNNLFSFLRFLKRDPVLAYQDLKRILIEARIFYERSEAHLKVDVGNYVRFLEKTGVFILICLSLTLFLIILLLG